MRGQEETEEENQRIGGRKVVGVRECKSEELGKEHEGWKAEEGNREKVEE